MPAEPEAERAVLRALHRSGVGGVAGLSCLIAAADLLAAVRSAHPANHVDLRVVRSAGTVHVEIDVTGLDVPEQATRQSDAFPATRWGTVRQHGRALLWADIDRSIDDVEPMSRTHAGLPGPVDPIEMLFDVTTRLARARTLDDIAAVVHGPLRVHLGANAAALAMRDAATVRLLSHDARGALRQPPRVGHPAKFSIGSDLPLAATIRDGTFRAYESTQVLERDFPTAGAQLRADNNDAFVTVPIGSTGRPIGALAVGWRGTRPLERLRPLLVIAARHAAYATNRVLSPPHEGTTTPPAGTVPRRSQRTPNAIAGLRIDVVSRQVFVPGHSEPVRLTGREFELLLFLGEQVGTARSRSQTLREVWGIDFEADTSVVDVTVSRLRRKLGAEVIVTVRDQGYMLRA
jgi:hypothetical protein